MTIRKKDGNVYILEGPNKLAKNQEVWDAKKLVFHNFSWEEIVWKNEKTKEKKPVVQEQKIQPEFVQEIKKEPEINQIDLLKKSIMAEQQVEKKEEKIYENDFPILKHKVMMHCLPSKIKKHKDDLYGDKWETLTYGKKFVFPSVVLSNNDLSLEFWTSDPNNQINEKSIIFPFAYEIYDSNSDSYDRIPFDEHRWWKITEKQKKDEGGWVFYAIPSADQPDFSD